MAYPYKSKGESFTADLGGFLSRLTNLHIGVPFLFCMIFLWLNGAYHWGAYWETTTALAYIIMFAAVLSIRTSRSQIWVTKVSFKDGALNFWLGFILMFAGLIVANTYLLDGALSSNTIVSSAVYPMLFLTVFFVAPVEETIFRGVLRDYFKDLRFRWLPLGILITSGAFAIMHQAVYQGEVMSLWWAFIMGCVFYLAVSFKPSKTRAALGVPGAIGMHSCYNLFVLGILSGGIVF